VDTLKGAKKKVDLRNLERPSSDGQMVFHKTVREIAATRPVGERDIYELSGLCLDVRPDPLRTSSILTLRIEKS
jgi:hypothetical protein